MDRGQQLTNGTSVGGRVPGVTVGGKTGTAEFCEYDPELEDCRRDEDDNLPTHAWYVAYAPYENPEIAVVTFIYDGGEGSEAAVPGDPADYGSLFYGHQPA